MHGLLLLGATIGNRVDQIVQFAKGALRLTRLHVDYWNLDVDDILAVK